LFFLKKMALKLTQICPSFSPETLNHSLILLKDSIFQNGSCFLSDFLHNLVKNPGNSIIFLGIQYNYSHYLNVSKKLGSNLENLINNGQVLYIDFFNKLSDWIPSELPITEEIPLFWKELPKKTEIFSIFSEENLEILFDKIEGFSNTKEKCWIFIENLNFLINSMNSSELSLNFLQSLFTILRNSKRNCNGFIRGSVDDENSENMKFIELLQMNSDIVMEISKNSSGFSKDFDGNVRKLLVFN